MWQKLLLGMLGVVIDKLVMPFINGWIKAWKRAQVLKEKFKKTDEAVRNYENSKTPDEAQDNFNKLP